MKLSVATPTVLMVSLFAHSSAVAFDEPPQKPPGDERPASRSEAAIAAPEKAPSALTDRPEDEAAIRETVARFTKAFNLGDANGVAASFTADAEMIDEHGDRIQGHDAIQAAFKELFIDQPNAKIDLTLDAIRFLGPDAAKEEGRSRLTTTPNQPPINRRYTVLYVKQGGAWLHSSVREELDSTRTPHDRLEELAWMTGDWIDESADSSVTVHCRWSDDTNFLIRDFAIHVQGARVQTVSERIGWDPLTRQIKSWVFDSEGGHGEGLWSRSGDRWLIKATGVLPDGRLATATHILSKEKPNMARWASTDRTLGGQIVPDLEEYILVRRPPSPSSH
jgi:uncharacterized protein (TIGR02246 family)